MSHDPPRQYAIPGTIPKPGEVWRAVGCKTTLLTLHLVEAARVRPLLPTGLRLLTPLPGRTLGGTLLTCYGPGSTLEYHEFGVVAGWVRSGRHSGFYISHLYVDSAASVEGGQRMGYPKELAHFDWRGPESEQVEISRDHDPLCALRWGMGTKGVRFPLAGATLSRRDDRIYRFRHLVSANWRFARAALEIPAASPLAELDLGRPRLALAGTGLTGDLGLDFAELPFQAPHR